ncbi:hypothetical protein ACFRAE_06880 [Sphingobacterium sp. HJSM2_6]|uniref:hypothetical protein n=1 Tax=Sphingobacterium sp. HJSM2_6 TaxID=3366264 RepID=UPI003BD75916
MENILGVLLVIGGILYKIYESYKEEQEKAKERMEKLKKQQKQSGTRTEAPRFEKTPTIPEISYQQFERKEQVKPIAIQETVPDEVVLMQHRRLEKARIEKQQKAQALQKRPQVQDIETETFDLRKAIIQQVILERPYKY